MWLEPLQVAGTHSAIYEAYYHQVDPNGTGMVQALDAARFLKKSRLSDVVLSKIWDLSDPTGKGYLDKAGLFVALKLVALAQAGKDINMSNIHSEAPPPKVGEIPKVPPAGPPARPAAPSPAPGPLGDWSMKPAERDKYSQLFDSLQPNNGLIAGNKVKGVLMESKLPLDTLGKIWDLADQDKDGMLDRHEFMVAMHLVYKALEKHAVPTTLPPELRARPPRPPSRPPSPRAPPPRPVAAQTNSQLLDTLLDFSSPPSQSPAPSPTPTPLPAASRWVVSASERAAAAAAFEAADLDRDGFVSGAEIKQTFLDSGLPQHTLAHIWALCDTNRSGLLSRNQFALAMWLVKRALGGEAPPAALTPEMAPPPDEEHIPQPELAPAPTLGPQPTPEMEAIAREVDALARERVALEAEIASKERELAANNKEADGLQSELDTLTATLKQLENQKGEAQKRLNDLKTQTEKLRSQVSAQEAAAAETEAEVAARRAALQSLREKERALRDEAAAAEAEAEAVTAALRRTVLAVSQANIKIAHLEEQYRLITEATAALASGGGAAAAHAALRPAFSREDLERVVRGATPNDALEDTPFPTSNGFSNGPVGFESDPFKDPFPAPAAPTPANDPFAPQHGNSNEGGFGADPFGGTADPFAGDAFAPHENNNKGDDSKWENDPFAVLHAPTRASAASGGSGGSGGGGGGSGGPALPPKSHKTPPPRPAPPRPNPPHKARAAMDFADDPFKDYRYEDPFNIEDPFAEAAPPRPGSVGAAGGRAPARGGRDSAPPAAAAWAAPSWPADAWDTPDAWPSTAPSAPTAPLATDAWGPTPTTNNTSAPAPDWKIDNWATKADGWAPAADGWATEPDGWANKTDNWTADWNTDKNANQNKNKNLNETWPSNTLPAKKEKSPKPVKYAKSLVHTIGGLGRTRAKKGRAGAAGTAGAGVTGAVGAGELPSEEQQWAWAAAESRRLQDAAERRRQQEDAELQLALAISRQEK